MKKLAISSLAKWWNPESYIGDECGFCEECNHNCKECKAPVLLCNDPKYMPSLFRKIYESIPYIHSKIKWADQKLVRLMQWALLDLIIDGKVKEKTRNLLEKVVLKCFQ